MSEEKTVATIETISKIYPAQNSDNLELANLNGLGWQCVINKGKYKVGDRVVFICPDSIVPQKPWSEFVFKQDSKGRVKKRMFRGNISDGLIMPLSTFAEELKEVQINPGMDIGNLIGVYKYVRVEVDEQESSVPNTKTENWLKKHKRIRSWLYKYLPWFFQPKGRTLGEFPSQLPKTDEDNLETKVFMLDEMRRICYINKCGLYGSIKSDGSSMTIFNHFGREGVCSRTKELNPKHDNDFSNMYQRLLKESKKNGRKTVVPKGYLVQGELVGPKIQGNNFKLSEHAFHAFNVFNIETNRLLDRDEFVQFCTTNGFNRVTEMAIPDNWIDWSVMEWKEFCNKSAKYNTPDGIVDGEGIVIRPVIGVNSNIRGIHQGRCSVKLINSNYKQV